MPFVGNASNSGSEQVSNAQTTRAQNFIGLADGVVGVTRVLDITGMSRAVVIVTQTAGLPGQFQVFARTQGNTPNIAFPPVGIGALNMPVMVPVPVSARALLAQVVGFAGGPHNFSVSTQVSAAS